MNFLDLVKKRHAVRDYDSRPVEKEKLDYIMECVRLAPSAVNFQPWRFKVITGGAELEAIRTVYHQPWFKKAPCVIVACTDHSVSWHRRADGKDHADIDAAIAVEHLCLAAAEQNLGTCWVCNFDVTLCRETLRLPENISPVALIPVGYPVSTDVPEKNRKTLDEISL